MFDRFLEWDLATISERQRKHYSESTYEEVLALHAFAHEKTDSGATRIEEALAYLDQFTPTAMPDQARRLLRILLSIAEITASVEAWGQVNPDFLGDFRRFKPLPDIDTQ